MSTTASIDSTVGFITLAGKIHSQYEELALRAELTDLAGVQALEFSDAGIQVRYNPALSGPHKFYRAVRRAGFAARGFQTVEA